VPIHHAVLGLLADGPSYGYELKSSFERAIGPQWGRLNIGHLYQVLDRLVREGLVVGRVVAQARRPDKTIYRLTKRGRLELNRWLGEPSARQSGYRDDFFLKLFVASRMGREHLRTALSAQREEYLTELAALGDLLARHKQDPLIALLLEAATLHTEANVRVVARAERRLDELAADGARHPASTSQTQSRGAVGGRRAGGTR
jgi:DNA-binding PadR family transcriptional regulator